MARDSDWFKMLPTTQRTADILARRHGYKNIKDLADSLTWGARVLDVGAGASSFGKVVARLRPDIHWTNLDFSYHDARILEDVKRGAPGNLAFVAGNATKLDTYIRPGSMDVVFSYWLLPHLSLYGPETALLAATRLFTAAKPGGTIAVGPRKHPLLHPDSLTGKSWRIKKDGALTAMAYAQEVERQTQFSAASRYVRKAFDMAAFDVFGTSRYLKGNGITRQQLYDPKSGTYIPLHDHRVVWLTGRLLGRTAARLIRLRRP